MTQRHIQVLAAVVVGLLLLMFVLNTSDDDTATGQPLFLPDFEARANDITRVQIPRAVGEAGMTIGRIEGQWTISEREGYPVDAGKLSALVSMLAGARIVEEKTSNPELYGRLGLDDPEAGGRGTKIIISGEGFAYSVILGDAAQGDYRYARVANQPASYLIDRNPDVPAGIADWLVADIIDMGAGKIRRVTISHADGESIVIEKDSQLQTDFSVLNIPEGRDLSYSTVGNDVGGALANLDLDDVRKSVAGEAATTVVFETWDDTRITATVTRDGESNWISIKAEPDVDGLNERADGWQYRLPEFKENLLTRRWDDLLKAAEED